MRDGKRSWVALVLASLFFVGIASGGGVSVGAGGGGPLAARAGYTPTSGQAVPVLDGNSLTIAQVISVARGAPISIPADVMNRVERSFQLLLEAAKEDKPIYGLTRGVGENKDKTIFQGGKLDEHARRLSEDFNANLLRVQSTAVGPPVSREIVRAAMVIRLNTMLIGHTGVEKQVVTALEAFLNKDITPLVPSKGTVGEADIDILSHVGLALMGEGNVLYEGRSMTAAQALRSADLDRIVPFGKDALSIFSSNAYSAAIAVFAADDARRMLEAARHVFALSLEGLNGNVAPFLAAVQEVRAFPGQRSAADQIVSDLQGSYLWSTYTPTTLPTPTTRRLQDPLSYRTASQVFGSADSSLNTLERDLTVQINSADDNPTVVLDAVPGPNATAQERSYYVNGNGWVGAVIPTANFEPLAWVLQLESLGVALAHVSSTSVERISRLGTHEFTDLSRFLSPDKDSIAFAAVQKIPADLDAENRDLANPVSTSSIPVAGDIEDTATNAAEAATHVSTIVDNTFQILAVELMHAAQAVNLRQHANSSLALGRGTQALLDAYRRRVPFLDKDRILSTDIQESYEFLQTTQVE